MIILLYTELLKVLWFKWVTPQGLELAESQSGDDHLRMRFMVDSNLIIEVKLLWQMKMLQTPTNRNFSFHWMHASGWTGNIQYLEK